MRGFAFEKGAHTFHTFAKIPEKLTFITPLVRVPGGRKY